MLRNLLILGISLSISFATPLAAHEFWIDPQRMQVETGGRLDARFRNGDHFKGVEYAYLKRASERLQMITPTQVLNLTPRDGDRPAIATVAREPGLTILAHETAPSIIRYDSWEKFEKFLRGKDLSPMLDAHIARGLPQDTFRESYTRHAKSLVAVGHGDGADRRLGLKTEIVALANPYASNFSGRLPVRVYYNGQPRRDIQVDVFEKAPGGKVTETKLRTDRSGQTVILTKPGHRYLLNAVVIRVPERQARDIAWETLWATLTFMVPAR